MNTIAAVATFRVNHQGSAVPNHAIQTNAPTPRSTGLGFRQAIAQRLQKTLIQKEGNGLRQTIALLVVPGKFHRDSQWIYAVRAAPHSSALVH